MLLPFPLVRGERKSAALRLGPKQLPRSLGEIGSEVLFSCGFPSRIDRDSQVVGVLSRIRVDLQQG
ncbi:hypothetical protein MPNT_80027 [Candidatus Methylacidithermus pantelleriae]|uniref:Uncharacterized protein n=1 Tax=Candidatus Methylacidithermus pantelleriae TaxID=2744239 RepID=A0A8J2FXE5_9BACT|nr:hypothetical protein MPNT_80027 [Candidatus Methylacidithermus pantelleriae]